MDAKSHDKYKIIKDVIKRKFRKVVNEKLLIHIFKLIYFYKYDYVADPDKIIYVDINDITAWYDKSRYKEFTFPGQIKGGDWSTQITTKAVTLEKSNKYKSIVQRFDRQMPWIETDIFKNRYTHFIQKGIKVKGCDSLRDIENHYIKYYDALFENIQEVGVLPSTDENPEIEPIYININKDGELLFRQDGNHRLFMCMVIGVNRIPVKVWLRHTEWQKKREYILSRSSSEIDRKYLKYVNHPDIITEFEQNEED